MSDCSQLILPQSTTTIAVTPPPSSCQPLNQARTPPREEKSNQRLQLYNSLFGQGKNKACEDTGLQFIQSLNYSLNTFLHLSDVHWVLAMIDIDDIDDIREKLGYEAAKRKIIQTGIAIKNFCDNDPQRLRGFKLSKFKDYNEDIFAMLMYCNPQLIKSEKYVSKLIKKITLLTNVKVSVGIAKMNEWETFEAWKQRTFDNMIQCQVVEQDSLYSDIGIAFVNPNINNTDDEKTRAQGLLLIKKFGKKKDFDAKMKEIANNENYDWTGAIMEIDEFESFVFLNNNDKDIIASEIDKMERQVYHLFDIYGNGYGGKTNELKYFAYRLNDDGSKIGLILYDSTDTNKCYIPGHEMLETLKEEISMQCSFTVSIGSSRLIEDDLGMADDWIERMNHNLKKAKTSGKSEIRFGNGNGGDNDGNADSDTDLKVNDVVTFDELGVTSGAEDDVIEMKSMQEIQKMGPMPAVNLDNAKIIVNNGDLVKESDFKCDYDPTQTLPDSLHLNTEMTFERIYFESMKFIQDNKDYLFYPKLFLNSKKPKCNKIHCTQCNSGDKNNNDNNGICLCEIQRRQIGNQLYVTGQQRSFLTDSLMKTVSGLWVSDRALLDQHKTHAMTEYWFAKLYAFLKWQQETANVVLHNLAYFQDSSQRDLQDMENFEILLAKKFELLTLVHAYLDEMVEYLILFYCAFGAVWTRIFYPFICDAVGGTICGELFNYGAQSELGWNSISVAGLSAGIIEMDDLKSSSIAIEKAKIKIVNAMKGLWAFKQVIYQSINTHDSAENLNQTGKVNVLAFINTINVKMNEMISNIKTQLLVQQMNGGKRNNGDKLVHEPVERVRIWHPQVPSFLALFVIRRVLCEYFFYSGVALWSSNTKVINEFVAELGIEQAQEQQASEMLLQLYNNGINKYMKQHYNHENETLLIAIDTVYDQIIKGKHNTIYEKVISYRDDVDIDNDSLVHQNLVFNTSDLMYSIFQWFGINYNRNDEEYIYGYDLHCCSLVNFHWLFHVWHPNSMYFVNLTRYYHIIEKLPARVWERFINVKSIRIGHTRFASMPADLEGFLNGVALLNKVSKIVGYIDALTHKEWIAVVMAILEISKNKIKHYDMHVNPRNPHISGDHKVFLPQAQTICISNFSYSIKWSFKCEYLRLYNRACTLDLEFEKYLRLSPFLTLTKEMCEYIIGNCDCSGITSLHLERVKFPFLDGSSDNGKLLLKKFAQKFENLKYFLYFNSSNIKNTINYGWEFRSLLEPIILKNNCIVDVMFNKMDDTDNQIEIPIKNGDIDENGLYTGNATFGNSKWYLTRKQFEQNKKHFPKIDKDKDNKLNVDEAWNFFQLAQEDPLTLQKAWKLIAAQHNDPELPKDGLSQIQFHSMFMFVLTTKHSMMKPDECPVKIPSALQFNVIRMYEKSAQEIKQMKDKNIKIKIDAPMIETVVREDELFASTAET